MARKRVKNPQRHRKTTRHSKTNSSECDLLREMGLRDENFAFIAGRTSGGFPYGTTWDEWETFESADGEAGSVDRSIESGDRDSLSDNTVTGALDPATDGFSEKVEESDDSLPL